MRPGLTVASRDNPLTPADFPGPCAIPTDPHFTLTFFQYTFSYEQIRAFPRNQHRESEILAGREVSYYQYGIRDGLGGKPTMRIAYRGTYYGAAEIVPDSSEPERDLCGQAKTWAHTLARVPQYR